MKKQIFILSLLFCGIVSAWGQDPYIWCHTTNSQLHRDFGDAYLTWQTADNGDVVITIDGATFRNGGFENDGTWEASWNVLSGDGYATSESASEYFTGGTMSADNTTYTLTKKADLPSDAIVQFRGHAFSWKIGTHDEYFLNPDLKYTYGSVCQSMDAPTNVAVTNEGVVTFTAVEGANKYIANVYSGSILKHTQEITNGGMLTFKAYVAGDYNVKLIASGAGKVPSEESDPVVWHMAASPLPESEYCGEDFSSGNTACQFAWVTLSNGNIEVTLTEPDGTVSTEAEHLTVFRSNAVDISKLKVDGVDASTYFTSSYSGNVQTFAIKDQSNKPALGSKITYDGTVEYKVYKDQNAWPTLQFDYTYGTKCTVAPTSIVLASTATVAVNKHKQLEASVLPMLAPQTVTWSSKNENVVKVDADGKITGVAEGEAVIRATSTEDENIYAECTVTVTAAVILPNSEYCGKEMGRTEGNGAAVLFTWETDDNGNIIITITEPDGSVTSDTHFRGDGVKVDQLKINDIALSTYFNSTVSETSNIQTLTLKDPTNAPELGSKIVYNSGQNVEYAVESNTNAWPVLSFEYTYGAVCSGKAVNAAVNDGTMGSAVAKQNGVEVTSVDPNTEVTFIAIPKETYRFMNWTQNGVVVSDEAEYEVIVTDNITLTANFDYIRDTYCHTAVKATNVDKTLYLTLAATGTENEYMIRIEGSAEAPLTGITSAEFKINNITVDWSVMHTDVVFTADHWTFDATGYGAATTTFALQEGKTLNDLHVWTRNIKFTSTAGNIEYTPGDDKFPNRYRIAWNTTCSDDEAPVMDAPKAVALNTTDIRLTLKATDNWEGPITYTISRTGAENIEIVGASGETKTYDVIGLATDATYTFSVVATDTKGNSCIAQECSVTLSAGGDVTTPTDVTVTARPMTDKSIELTLFANDDYDGDITYTITSVPSVSIGNVVAPRGTTTKTVVHTLTANTEYTFSVVATDAAGNEAAAVSTSATTFSGNLALGQPATAGIDQANANKSNDGDNGTRWGSNGGIHYDPTTHPDDYQDWWYVDLGAVYDLGTIRALWETACPKDYTFRTSYDGKTWTVIATYSEAPAIKPEIVTYSDLASTAQGRYVGIWATSGYANLAYGISPWEIEVYGTPAVDTEAPVITEFVANGASATSILVRATATDNFCGDLTYTFYCEGVAIATPVVQLAGTEATYIFNNLENKEYTFKVVVSDGTKETTSEEIKASPVAGDDQAPTDLAVSNIVPEYNRVTFDLSAIDNNGGMITYIVKNGDTQVATADALSGAKANIVVESLNYLTDYAFTATAQDASGNTCEPINIEFTTTAPPFPLEAAPAPRAYPQTLVRPIYSDAFPDILAHGFLKTTWVNIGVEERTIDDDKFLFYTVTEVAHATAWGQNDNGENAIIALDGYNDGTNKGVDIRQMNMLHVDLWSKVACQNVELRVCDALVATVRLDGTGWNSFDINISSLSDDVKTNVRWVKFDGFTEANTFAIDNFFFYQKYNITLDEAQDNTTAISTNDGKYADVTLNRTFARDGYNYTLCLPFDMTAEQCLEAFGEDYKLWEMGEAYMKSADMIYLPFSEVTSIEAGKPYIFCPAVVGAAIVNPIIAGVTINATASTTIGNDVAKMTGIYSPYTLPVENNYVLGEENWLYQSNGDEMKGLRCYFTLTPSAATAGVRARAIFNRSDVVTDLEPIHRFTDSPIKVIENGRFVIIRNNARYNGMGQQVK